MPRIVISSYQCRIKTYVGKKIDNDKVYSVNSELYRQLNELAFVEQLDVRSTPDAAPKKQGLLASAYIFMTAPFSVRTPSNVMTRNRRRKSSPNKLVHCIGLKWLMAFSGWSQMADSHLSQSQKASHWPFRPRLKGPPWSQMANTS